MPTSRRRGDDINHGRVLSSPPTGAHARGSLREVRPAQSYGKRSAPIGITRRPGEFTRLKAVTAPASGSRNSACVSWQFGGPRDIRRITQHAGPQNPQPSSATNLTRDRANCFAPLARVKATVSVRGWVPRHADAFKTPCNTRDEARAESSYEVSYTEPFPRPAWPHQPASATHQVFIATCGYRPVTFETAAS